VSVALEAIASTMQTTPFRPLLNVLLSLNKVREGSGLLFCCLFLLSLSAGGV